MQHLKENLKKLMLKTHQQQKLYLNFSIAYAGLQLGFLQNRIQQLFLMPRII